MNLPAWVQGQVRKLPSSFFGKVVLNIHNGSVANINVEQSIKAPPEAPEPKRDGSPRRWEEKVTHRPE